MKEEYWRGRMRRGVQLLLVSIAVAFICGCKDSSISCPGGDSWGGVLNSPEGIIVFENVNYTSSESRTIIAGTVRNVSSSRICISQVYVYAWDTKTYISGTTKILWSSVYNVPYRQRPIDSGETLQFTFDASIDNSKVVKWQYYVHGWF